MTHAEQTVAPVVPGRERTTLTMALSGVQMDALERMMEETEQTRTELVRRGLQLLGEQLGIPFPIRLRVL